MAAIVDKKPLRESLDKFPSSFELKLSLTKHKVKHIIKTLEDDRSTTNKLPAEAIQISNFLSYLKFLQGEHEQALEHTNESLQTDPDNITANVNRARILLDTGESPSDVENIVEQLEKLEQRDVYNRRKCCAEADMAYAYSRCGPWYCQKAVDIFTEVVSEYPAEFPWKYRLGLTLLRQAHCLNSLVEDIFNPRKKRKLLVQAAEQLLDVAENSQDINLSGKSWCKLGRVVFDISKNKYEGIPDHIQKLRAKTCFEKAVEISPDDVVVLETCGQFARYRKEIDTSETLLRKALGINPTCHSYHHLALTLKRKVEDACWGHHHQDNDWRGGRCQADKLTRGNQRQQQQKKQQKKQQKNLRELIKSPFEVVSEPGNKFLIEAIDLLQRVKHAQMVRYDMGIIYRMLEQPEQAGREFKAIVSQSKYLPNPSLLANVYEQLGICLLQMSKSDGYSPAERQKYDKDSRAHLYHAVEIQSEIVAKDHRLKTAAVWKSYDTLKDLLQNKTDKIPKELAVLHMRMGDHGDSIKVYQEIIKEDKGEMNAGDYRNMLESYRKKEQFNEAVLLLHMLECTTIFTDIPRTLVVDVFIDSAFNAYSTDNTVLARQRFRSAYQLFNESSKNKNSKVPQEGTEDEDDEQKDFLILHSCEDSWECKHPKCLGQMINGYTGLPCTINDDDVLPGKSLIRDMISIMQSVPCIIIMTHSSGFIGHLEPQGNKEGGGQGVERCDKEFVSKTQENEETGVSVQEKEKGACPIVQANEGASRIVEGNDEGVSTAAHDHEKGAYRTVPNSASEVRETVSVNPSSSLLPTESNESYEPNVNEGELEMFQFYIEHALKESIKKAGPKVLVVADVDESIPDMVRTRPRLQFPPLVDGTLVNPGECVPREHRDWIRTFIKSATGDFE